MHTTLNKIRDHCPCRDGWAKLLRHLGKTEADDEPLSLLTVLDSNGLDDALWCLRAVDGFEKEMRLFAVACARDVQHLMTDPRSLRALDVAEEYAHGRASREELDAAWNAASDAACNAASDAAWNAAWAEASYAAWAATWAAAWAATWAAAREKQAARFREMVLAAQKGAA